MREYTEFLPDNFLESSLLNNLPTNIVIIISKLFNQLTKNNIAFIVKVRKNGTLALGSKSISNLDTMKEKTTNFAILFLNKNFVKVHIKDNGNITLNSSKDIDKRTCKIFKDSYLKTLPITKKQVTLYLPQELFKTLRKHSTIQNINLNNIIIETLNNSFDFFFNKDHRSKFEWYIRNTNIRHMSKGTLYRNIAALYIVSALEDIDKYFIVESKKLKPKFIEKPENMDNDFFTLINFVKDLITFHSSIYSFENLWKIENKSFKILTLNATKIVLGLIDFDDLSFRFLSKYIDNN